MTNPENSRRTARWSLGVALLLVVSLPLAVFAAHRFNDVPDSNIFHDDIAWLADNEVTLGCNPPANDEFCPSDPVARAQMAAFMRRFAGTFGNAGTQVLDFEESILVDTTDWVELLAVEADVVAEASVSLNAHAYVERASSPGQRYEFKIAPGDCEADPVGVGWWRPGQNTETSFQADTISLTGFDVISEPTRYVLCAAKFTAGGPDIAAHMRGITASWSPNR